jgi:hypothetical protein
MGHPCIGEAVFQLNGVRYQYGFRLTGREVVGEWLCAYVTHRRQVWLERDVSSPDVWCFGKSFAGRNKVIADLTRLTALFLSAAAAKNHRLAMGAERFFRDRLNVAWPLMTSRRGRATRRAWSRMRSAGLRLRILSGSRTSYGATVLYPLTDFSPRKTENLERGYLQGRYGAIPFLDGQVTEELAERLVGGGSR